MKKKLTYQERLAGYEADKARLSPKLDWWTYEQAIKDLMKKWRL